MIIKEYCPKVNRVVLRSDTYCHTLEYINELFNEAKKDFPALVVNQVEVILYGGERYKRTWGIEFNPIAYVRSDEKWIIPLAYHEIDVLELSM